MHIMSEFLHVSASVNKKVNENVHEREIFQIATSDVSYFNLYFFDEYSMTVIGYKKICTFKSVTLKN